MRSHQRNQPWLRLVVGLVAAALLAAACGNDDGNGADGAAPEPTEPPESTDGPDGEDPEWEALLEDARSEGRVVLYSSNNPTSLEQLEDGFEQAYSGIDLEFLRESSSVLVERVEGERAAGAVGADVVLISNAFWVQDEFEAGRGSPIDVLAPGNEDTADECVADEGYVIAGTDVVGVVYNPSAISDPQSLDDFVGISGGLADTDTSAVPVFLYETMGWDWLEAVAASDASTVVNPSAPDTINAVGAGEQGWGVANATQVVPVREEGSPIELFVPDPAPGFTIPAFALADAENPAAAQVLLNFIISQEGQEIFTGDGAGITCRDDIPSALDPPDDLVLFSREHVDPDFLGEGQERFNQMFR